MTSIIPVSYGSGRDALVLSVSEDAYLGDAQFTVAVDGVAVGGAYTASALHSTGATQKFALDGNWGSGYHKVAVSFINDAWGGTPDTDRNLYVDSVTYDSQAATEGVVSYFTNGSFTFNISASATAPLLPVSVSYGSGGDALVLSVSEDAYLGDAQFTVAVDGVAVGGTYTASALHSTGATQKFTLDGNWGSGYHKVAVSFINDAWGGTPDTDRNLYVDSVTYDGQAVQGSGNATLLSDSTANFATSAFASEVVYGSGGDALALSVSEDAYLGDAQFTVTVDGVAVGGIYTASALHASGATQKFTLNGNWGSGAHTVAVSFINDAWGGTADTDRNLYVDSVAYDSKVLAAGSATLLSNGATNFSVPAVPVSSIPVSVPAFHVSPTGNDAADGSAAHPFATLLRAEVAMQQGSIKTTYVDGGTYLQSSALTLTAADNGESFIATSGQTATLTGNLPTLMTLNGAIGITIRGLTFLGTSPTPVTNGQGELVLNGASGNTITANHFMSAGGDGVLLENAASNNAISGNFFNSISDSAIELKDGSNANLVDSNTINGTASSGTSGGGVFGHGIKDNVISHNVIENTAGMGIGILDFGGGTSNYGNTIKGNILSNNDTQSYDSGAIYLLGRSDNDVSTTVTNNFISANADVNNHTVGIYLDDLTSGVAVRNNIIKGSLSYDLQIHGGNLDTFSNNIFDLGMSGTTKVALVQAAPSDVAVGALGTFNGDAIFGNIIAGNSSGSEYYDYYGVPYSSVMVHDNDYLAGIGGNTAPDSSPAYVPQTFSNPTAGDYSLAGGGGAASIGFQPIDMSGLGVRLS